MTTCQEPIVIVGAGHSGARAAAALRKHGWTGGISLVGEEQCLPYDRPPLSKAVLLGKKTGEQCALYAGSWYAENGIDLLLAQSVDRIDRHSVQVMLQGGRSLAYHRLLLATGSSINSLTVSGADLNGVLPLRTPQHAHAIADSLQSGSRLVVIGGGVIGLEVAAAALQRGCTVTVLERAPQAMGRSVPAIVSEAVVAEHRHRGVDVRFGVEVASLDGTIGVQSVRLSTGEALPCDIVVYGLGVRPNADLAAAAGLSTDNGIRTDPYLRTDDDRIFACGDVCCYDSRLYKRAIRLENWRNAEDQADTAARNMLGQQVPFDAVPWFWSNQYDFALQVAGLPSLGTETKVETIGRSRLFLSTDAEGVLRGASAIGSIRDIAGPIKEFKTALAATAS
ncbi:NAD(P)/FAD-dependent oxidoreductase [Variovorax sp. YR566]|uniref:NAD(P)/FAD-dependent oxidoreductase n=1 Tax=Variovorax sp. YR566 TaxID=3450237 RepID=UPI003F7D28BC